MKTLCIKDQGLQTRIPETHIPMTYFVEAYHRLDGDLEELRTGFLLEPWQLHTAMAIYCASDNSPARTQGLLRQSRQHPVTLASEGSVPAFLLQDTSCKSYHSMTFVILRDRRLVTRTALSFPSQPHITSSQGALHRREKGRPVSV